MQQGAIRLIILIAIMLAGLFWYTNLHKADLVKTDQQQEQAKPELPPVVVAAARKEDFAVSLFGLGAITPLNTVEVHSRVNGQLMKIAFKEGQMVKKGDFIAEIDSRPFKTQITRATGQLHRDKALLDNARKDLKRYRTLLKQDSISSQLVDTQQSLVNQYQAAIQADQEVINNAKIQIGYTHIVAPISGRAGFSQISPGNIIRASDSRGIVKISQVDPISVIFPIPEDKLPRVLDLLATGEKIQVDIYDRALKEKLAQGQLLAIDNQIDATTGTIKLKAQLPNPEGRLYANQFVNAKMVVETLTNAITVPLSAIQYGVPGSFVYIINDEQIATVTPITIGPSQNERAVIIKGISLGDQVVVVGADRLRGGEKVSIVSKQNSAKF